MLKVGLGYICEEELCRLGIVSLPFCLRKAVLSVLLGMCVNVKLLLTKLSHVWLFYDPMDSSLPGSSVRGISQARILEWIVIFFSRGPFLPRVQTRVSCTAGRFFTTEPPRGGLAVGKMLLIYDLQTWELIRGYGDGSAELETVLHTRLPDEQGSGTLLASISC